MRIWTKDLSIIVRVVKGVDMLTILWIHFLGYFYRRTLNATFFLFDVEFQVCHRVIFKSSFKSFLFYLKFDLLLLSNLNQNWHLSYMILLFCASTLFGGHTSRHGVLWPSRSLDSVILLPAEVIASLSATNSLSNSPLNTQRLKEFGKFLFCPLSKAGQSNFHTFRKT